MKKYKIPANILAMMNEQKFLEAFLDNLHYIMGITLNNSYYEIESLSETTGYAQAFQTACRVTSSDELLKYRMRLNWQYGDLFDAYISNILKEKNMIINIDDIYRVNIEAELKDHLHLSENEYFICSKCGKYILKRNEYKNSGECAYCNINRNNSSYKNANNYYLEQIKINRDYLSRLK